jgi:hypothetical protein
VLFHPNHSVGGLGTFAGTFFGGHQTGLPDDYLAWPWI